MVLNIVSTAVVAASLLMGNPGTKKARTPIRP